jgi:chromosome partitioning protein
MGQSIAVMNTKGGVGKSTIVMALAETLSTFHGKNILVIDSDSQTSMSSMLMHISRWEQLERQQRTLVDYLTDRVLGSGQRSWREFVATGVSDVEEAETLYLVPSHMELSLFEREVSAAKRDNELRAAIRSFLVEAKQMFDLVLIDCPPGLSLLTECWLREADFFMPPTKPDYLAVRGLSILKRFREQHAEQGFAQLLGVLINLKDGRIGSEEEWHRKLAEDPANRCFQTVIPRRAYIQRAADFDPERRTYIAKYPGDAGQSIRMLAQELLARLAGQAWAQPAARLPGVSAAPTVQTVRPAPMAQPATPSVLPQMHQSAPQSAQLATSGMPEFVDDEGPIADLGEPDGGAPLTFPMSNKLVGQPSGAVAAAPARLMAVPAQPMLAQPTHGQPMPVQPVSAGRGQPAAPGLATRSAQPFLPALAPVRDTPADPQDPRWNAEIAADPRRAQPVYDPTRRPKVAE